MPCATAVVYHESYGRRGFTALRHTWNRYQHALAMLDQSPLRHHIPLLDAPAAGENEILRVHTPDYVDLVQRLDMAGTGKLDGSTPAWNGMYARAERVVGGSLLAADLIAAGTVDHVFNPAGGQHHAHAGRGGGFCVFNDVVAAVRRFQEHGFDRIVVLDVDGHHGDGTESLLLREPVLTISLHQYGERTYPGTGKRADIGEAAGLGYNLNLPLVRNTGDAAYLSILHQIAGPAIRAYRPQVLIVEYGTDAHWADPLLRLRLSTAAYASIARWVHDLSHELCGGRLLVVGGGGYEPEHVVRCWLLMLAELAGMPLDEVHPEVGKWLAEPAPSADLEAEARSIEAAAAAWQLLDGLSRHARPNSANACWVHAISLLAPSRWKITRASSGPPISARMRASA